MVEALALSLVDGRIPKRDWCQVPATICIAAVEAAIERTGFKAELKKKAA